MTFTITKNSPPDTYRNPKQQWPCHLMEVNDRADVENLTYRQVFAGQAYCSSYGAKHGMKFRTLRTATGPCVSPETSLFTLTIWRIS